jgi:DNA-binding response OmpR family regulator
VYADPDRLAQVVTNLVSNAVKFSAPHDEVVVAIDDGDGTVRIAVRDHGPGIPNEFRPRLFEKFAQAEATDARRQGGTGLGLSIVKQIVTRLGGAVGFEDAAGGGTVFSIELPGWAEVAAGEIDADASPEAVPILLCEDDLDAATTLREGLQPLGFRTDFAHSPGDAIERARTGAYAAIVIDLDLPDADGVDLVRRLREQAELSSTPIVVMYTYGGWEQNGVDASKLDVLEWIEKPVNSERLAVGLNRAGLRGADRQPHILHVDDDRLVLDLVARSLRAMANVVSADSVEEARCALATQHFDLAILDISLGAASGLDLLPELHSGNGNPIPVIIFSAYAAEREATTRVEVNLNKAGPLRDLVAAVRDRLMSRFPHAAKDSL